MRKSQSLFNLTTALHVSGNVTITHLQKHKTTVTTVSGNHYTILMSAAVFTCASNWDYILEHTKQNCAPSWIYLQDCTRMHGQENIKLDI